MEVHCEHGTHLIRFDLARGNTVRDPRMAREGESETVGSPKSNILTGLEFLRTLRCLLISSSMASDLFFASCSTLTLFSLSRGDSLGGGAKT